MIFLIYCIITSGFTISALFVNPESKGSVSEDYSHIYESGQREIKGTITYKNGDHGIVKDIFIQEKAIYENQFFRKMKNTVTSGNHKVEIRKYTET